MDVSKLEPGHYVRYKVIGFKGDDGQDKEQLAGPYEWKDLRSHFEDISLFEGVYDASVLEVRPPDVSDIDFEVVDATDEVKCPDCGCSSLEGSKGCSCGCHVTF